MKPVHILLVEDNEGDIVLTLEAFNGGKLKNTVSVVKNGEEVVKYLNKEQDYVNTERPDLILLDINLPRMDGKQVLAYIKGSDSFKSIPVVILTTSSSETDINEAYAASANCYITKPFHFDKFVQVVRSIEDFWINIVRLPSTQ